MDTTAASSSLQKSSSSTPNFFPIFDKALKEYEKKTRENLTTHPLAAEINRCRESPQAILTVLERQANELNLSQNSDERLTKWLDPTVNVLVALATTLGNAAGLVSPPTTIIFSGIGILLVAAKNTAATRDILVELFEKIESFFKRIKTYTEATPTPDLIEALAMIMAEVLSILAIATKGMKAKWWKIFFKELAGMNNIRDALQSFTKLEHGELLGVIARVSADTRSIKYYVMEINAATNEIVNKMDPRKHSPSQDIVAIDGGGSHIEIWKDFLLDLQRWLSPSEPLTNYKLGIDAYHDGTATWFMEGNTFQDWLTTGSLLWVHGKSGSGKTVLCSVIIQRILSMCHDGRASVGYFYFDFGDEKKKLHHNLLSSLLVQFASQSIPCCDIMFPVYSAHGNGKQPPSVEVLMTCLKDVLSASSQYPMYIIMDAIDECPNSPSTRSPRAQVLRFVQELVALRLKNLHICLTSRPEIDIRACLEPLTSLRVSLHDQNGHKADIASYIRFKIDFISHDKRWRNVDKELVVETLSDKADGIFRWVFCQLHMLRLCVRSRVRQFVNELPDNLDETYERVLKKIPKRNQGHVRRLLQCMAVAIRPLRVEELVWILTFDYDGIVTALDANSRSEDQERKLVSACPSFITIVDDNGSRLVQFSHLSVKEFLTSTRLSTSTKDIARYHILLDAAHTTMAEASLAVLLRSDDRLNRWSARNTPFARYASEHWVSHVQTANPSARIMHMMETLFDLDQPHFSWVRIYDMDKSNSGPHKNPAKPLYYAALWGFDNLVEHLVNRYPGHVNALGGQHDYPLVAALHQGYIQVADLLLRNGANVNGQGTDGQAPLHQLIRRFDDRALGAVRFLLEHGAFANAQQRDLSTPLHLAAAWGNVKILFDPAPILSQTELVQLLLTYGANVHAEDSLGQTPLHRVSGAPFFSEEGSRVVNLLMDRGADVNKRDKDNQTPLHLASYRQHLKLVQVLLDHGANITAEDTNGRNPLHRVIEGHFKSGDGVSIVRLLLGRGVNVNTGDKHHITPLHSASYRQHLKSVRVLLDLGANLSAEDNEGRTPLHHVLEGPFVSEDGVGIVQLLVKRGADVNTPDNNQITPLHIASYRRKLKSVRVLLNLGAHINAEDSQGRTPLHQVFGDRSIHEDGFGVVRLLVERGANVNTPDRHDLTPLHFASYCLHLESVRVLLDRGAHVNAEDSQGRTPLQQVFEGRSAPKDSVGVVQLLVERGANVNTRDRHHHTPLHFASYRQHLESVWVLLNHRANIDAEDSQGQTPLHRVLEAPSIFDDGVYVVRLLAERGASVNTRRVKDHITPLHLASRRQHRHLVLVLLDYGAHVHAENNQGLTALHQVFEDPYIYEDGVDVVQLLAERGADVNARNKALETPLHLASRRQRPKSVRMLLDHGTNVNTENTQGRTPLHLGLESSYISNEGTAVTQLLVEHGADVNIPDKDYITPLHLASHRQHLESVQVLIDHGADVNAEDSQGRTPLHQVLASSYLSEDGVNVVRLLVERGANVNARDKYRITPLHSASYRVYSRQSVRQLLHRGANNSAEENWARTPFHPVLDNRPQYDPGNQVIPELLVAHGADVNARDEDHETPLHLVSRLGLFERAWVLLERGADRNVENKDGKTPFQIAQESIRAEMRREPPGFFKKTTIAERVALMSLLYGL